MKTNMIIKVNLMSFILMALNFIFLVKAQNLDNFIINGSFEDKIRCPRDVGEFKDCISNFQVYSGSTDYYHPCNNSINGLGGVPSNSRGYMYAHSGDAYAGIITLEKYPSTIYDYKEYIQTNFNLKQGKVYTISFYASLSSKSQWATKLSAHLSTTIPDESINGLDKHLSVNKSEIQTTNAIIDNIGSWSEITFMYTAPADGKYYLTIGEFSSENEVEWKKSTGGTDPYDEFAHYYIDDISVIGPGCCPNEMRYENTSSLPSLTQVENNIIAGFDAGIPRTEGDVIVKTGQTVTFKAKNIKLLPGFRVERGSNFSAVSEDCNPINKLNGDPITEAHATGFMVCCDRDQYFFKSTGADHYQIRIFTRNGQKFFDQSGEINSDITYVWDFKKDGQCLPTNTVVTIMLDLSNCDHEHHVTFTLTITHINCRIGEIEKDTTNSLIIEEQANNTELNISEKNNFSDLLTDNPSNYKNKNEYSLGDVKKDFRSEINIYPNPAFSHTSFLFNSLSKEKNKTILSIYNLYGNLIKKYDKVIYPGFNSIEINLTDFKEGIYIVKFLDNISVKSTKLIVLR